VERITIPAPYWNRR